eukprot:gene26112-11829_t
MDRLVSILEDMGHRDDTDMVDSIGGMSGSVKSMADAQHELNPYMFKALEGIAGLAQQEQAKAKESMLQESYSMLMKLEQDKDKMPLETYNKMWRYDVALLAASFPSLGQSFGTLIFESDMIGHIQARPP